MTYELSAALGQLELLCNASTEPRIVWRGQRLTRIRQVVVGEPWPGASAAASRLLFYSGAAWAGNDASLLD